jgi:hypothetical protein
MIHGIIIFRSGKNSNSPRRRTGDHIVLEDDGVIAIFVINIYLVMSVLSVKMNLAHIYLIRIRRLEFISDMKTDNELERIAFDISEQVKLFLRANAQTTGIFRIKRLNKEANEMYAILRNGFELSTEENKKVDKIFGRIMILGSRKLMEEKKLMR